MPEDTRKLHVLGEFHKSSEHTVHLILASSGTAYSALKIVYMLMQSKWSPCIIAQISVHETRRDLRRSSGSTLCLVKVESSLSPTLQFIHPPLS